MSKPTDSKRMAWLSNNPRINYNYECEEDQCWWTITKESGNRSDREWEEVARGFTLRAAIDAAMAKLK